MPETVPETTDPALWTATRQAAAIRNRTLSSRELLAAMTARIERLNPAVNAVVTLDLARGVAAATAADAATARGESSGPLHGLPVTIKDALAVAGLRSTGGAVELRDHVAMVDADAPARAFAAGAYCFGKTNLPRWSGDIQSYNEIFGTTNNPWNLLLVPGGSSGGAATAVALGMTSFEIGTDIGGSIRIPAAYCGVAGHKPSYGLVPCGGYLDGPDGGLTEPDINVHGPIARSVDDLELLLGVLAGPTPERAKAWTVALAPPRRTSVEGLRVALWADDPGCPVSAATASAVRRAGAALDAAGAHVDDCARPAFEPGAAALLGLGLVGSAITPSLSDGEFAYLAAIAGDRNQTADQAEMIGAYVIDHRGWLGLDRERARVRRAWAAFFENHDVLLCPVIACPPFPHLQTGSFVDRTIEIDGATRPYRDLIWWTVLIGMAYLPSTVVPVGRTVDGLPIGVQVVGPYLEDRTTLAVARALVELCGPITPPPMALA